MEGRLRQGEISMLTTEKSFITKGIAILMMMWHHCFLPGRYDGFSIVFWPLAENQVIHIANFCKICVSLFVFISGYGLFVSYTKQKQEAPSQWITERLGRTISGYWFVVVLVWIISNPRHQRNTLVDCIMKLDT